MLLLCPGLTLNHSLQRHLATDEWEIQRHQLLTWTGRWLSSWGTAMLWSCRAVTLLSVGWISRHRAVTYAIFSSFFFPTDTGWCRRILNKDITFICYFSVQTRQPNPPNFHYFYLLHEKNRLLSNTQEKDCSEVGRKEPQFLCSTCSGPVHIASSSILSQTHFPKHIFASYILVLNLTCWI